MSKRKQIEACVDIVIYTMENYQHDKKPKQYYK